VFGEGKGQSASPPCPAYDKNRVKP
jgi:hypothetical protein